MKTQFSIFPKLVVLTIGLAIAAAMGFQLYESIKAPGIEVASVQTPVAYGQAATVVPTEANATADTIILDNVPLDTPLDEAPAKTGIWAFILQHWGELLLGLFTLAEAIVRITPTEKDNSIVNFLKHLLDFVIPNRRKGVEGAH